jgi:hypothetical protein
MRHLKLNTSVITPLFCLLVSLVTSTTTLASVTPSCPSAADLKLAYIQVVYPNDWAPELWNATGKLNINGLSWDIEVDYLTMKNDTEAFQQAQSAIASITSTPPLQMPYDGDITCSYHTTIDPHIIVTAESENHQY